jgi:exodeoxyribonuclease III
MEIATWNVNSVRARLPRLLAWLEERRPDVVLLQETKCLEEAFPREPLEDQGWQVETFGQKTYNGVAILSRRRIEGVERGFPDDGEDAERRLIGATIEDVMVLSVYAVNGVSVGHERYREKLAWFARLRDHVAERYPMGEKVVLAGDFNVTFDDRDVYDPEKWRERILCSTPEREALAGLTGLGLADAFRKFHEEGGHYTWWDFRTFGWKKDHGLRIDHLLMSPPALEACSGVEIDKAARGGSRPSDHAPVIATLG